jgi:leucine dehydrogenase
MTEDALHELDHELLQVFRDPQTGLTGAIAIHSTALGPSMGGLRLHAYAGVGEAVVDALRLSRAMSLKNAAAGLDLGGGKAVLIDDGRWDDRARRMRAFGQIVEDLGGRYVTAEDVGTSPADMSEIAGVTSHVAGQPVEDGGSGDPSPYTARTVLGAIRGAVELQLGTSSLDGVHVAVSGVGNVGGRLVEQLTAAGARVSICDARPERARAVAERTGAELRPVDGFLHDACDVLAPCALGGVIGGDDVDRLRCVAIAGSANNPLADAALADALAGRGIVYVPDFLANCGGIIHVGAEVLGFAQDEVDARIEASIQRTSDLLVEARRRGVAPLHLAIDQALRRMRPEGASDRRG